MRLARQHEKCPFCLRVDKALYLFRFDLICCHMLVSDQALLRGSLFLECALSSPSVGRIGNPGSKLKAGHLRQAPRRSVSLFLDVSNWRAPQSEESPHSALTVTAGRVVNIVKLRRRRSSKARAGMQTEECRDAGDRWVPLGPLRAVLIKSRNCSEPGSCQPPRHCKKPLTALRRDWATVVILQN